MPITYTILATSTVNILENIPIVILSNDKRLRTVG